MMDFRPLDNPIWNALTTGQAAMALSNGAARRFPGEVSPLAGLEGPTAAAFADLEGLVEPDGVVALFTTGPVRAPDGWEVDRARLIEQMIYAGPAQAPPSSPSPLGPRDVPDMVALAAATEPGPFSNGTIRMGRYFGIRSSEGRVIAMAGERLRLDGFTEISAVCTRPEFRGRGYARALVSFLASRILEEGGAPFLHVKAENEAKALYESIGFRVRRAIQLTVIARR